MGPIRTAGIQEPVINTQNGLFTRAGQNWANAISRFANAAKNLIFIGGPNGAGTSDTSAFQGAINQANDNGGGLVFIGPGVYYIDMVTIPKGTAAIYLLGVGDATVIRRRSNLTPGHGMFDVYGSNVTFDSMMLDGQVTTPAQLFYNQDFMGNGLNDPKAPSLSNNSLVWAHGPLSNLAFYRVTWTHASGYSALIDADTGGIEFVSFVECKWVNNRPCLFGIIGGQAIYGSWGGGMMVHGDGRASAPGCILKHLLVSGCTVSRVSGNAIWSHLYGLDELHQDFRIIGNSLSDTGLDGILPGGVLGGVVTDNVLHRVGYVTMTDDDRPVPRWLVNLNATAIDSSGQVRGVNYQGNSIISCNGGAMDLDGHCESSLIGNFIKVPYPDEAEYEEDSIAICGPNNDGQNGYGVNMGNTYKQPHGATDMTISGNTFVNLRAGAIRIFGSRRIFVTGNNIVAPVDSLYPPVAMGPLGTEDIQRCTDNRITMNDIQYAPTAAAPAIAELSWYAPFTADDVNTICANTPITGGGHAYEFMKDPNSGSPHYSEQVWWP